MLERSVTCTRRRARAFRPAMNTTPSLAPYGWASAQPARPRPGLAKLRSCQQRAVHGLVGRFHRPPGGSECAGAVPCGP
jgi:hypothetical protein